MASKQALKKAVSKAQGKYRRAPKSKAAKSALKSAIGALGGKMAGPRRTVKEISQPITLIVCGVELQVIERARDFVVIGDYPAHMETAIEELLVAMLDGESVSDLHAFDKNADLTLETFNVSCALLPLKDIA